jgi:hypothetical protein
VASAASYAAWTWGVNDAGVRSVVSTSEMAVGTGVGVVVGIVMEVIMGIRMEVIMGVVFVTFNEAVVVFVTLIINRVDVVVLR